mmetsp:Transcript_37022/g.67532  ORF Transcript_37022/g.67532 Transcript_37022/m.67532 type:complete len:158 (-) Transcript_37022:1047-1520(-)
MAAMEIEDQRIVTMVIASADQAIALKMASVSPTQIVVSKTPAEVVKSLGVISHADHQSALIASASARMATVLRAVHAFTRIRAHPTLEAPAGYSSARSTVAPRTAITASVDVTMASAPKMGFAFSKRRRSAATLLASTQLTPASLLLGARIATTICY